MPSTAGTQQNVLWCDSIPTPWNFAGKTQHSVESVSAVLSELVHSGTTRCLVSGAVQLDGLYMGNLFLPLQITSLPSQLCLFLYMMDFFFLRPTDVASQFPSSVSLRTSQAYFAQIHNSILLES